MGELNLLRNHPISKQPSPETCQWMMNFFAKTSIPRMSEEEKRKLINLYRRQKHVRL